MNIPPPIADLETLPFVARAAGVSPSDAAEGYRQLLAWCGREGQTTVHPLQVRGFFGGDACAALEAFLLLGPAGGDGRHTVRAVVRRLALSEAKRRGGLARAASASTPAPPPPAPPAPAPTPEQADLVHAAQARAAYERQGLKQSRGLLGEDEERIRPKTAAEVIEQMPDRFHRTTDSPGVVLDGRNGRPALLDVVEGFMVNFATQYTDKGRQTAFARMMSWTADVARRHRAAWERDQAGGSGAVGGNRFQRDQPPPAPTRRTVISFEEARRREMEELAAAAAGE